MLCDMYIASKITKTHTKLLKVPLSRRSARYGGRCNMDKVNFPIMHARVSVGCLFIEPV